MIKHTQTCNCIICQKLDASDLLWSVIMAIAGGAMLWIILILLFSF